MTTNRVPQAFDSWWTFVLALVAAFAIIIFLAGYS